MTTCKPLLWVVSGSGAVFQRVQWGLFLNTETRTSKLGGKLVLARDLHAVWYLGVHSTRPLRLRSDWERSLKTIPTIYAKRV